MSEACKCVEPKDVFNRVCARCLNPIEKQMTQEQTNGKARVWWIGQHGRTTYAYKAPNIAPVPSVKVVEYSAYEKAVTALQFYADKENWKDRWMEDETTGSGGDVFDIIGLEDVTIGKDDEGPFYTYGGNLARATLKILGEEIPK